MKKEKNSSEVHCGFLFHTINHPMGCVLTTCWSQISLWNARRDKIFRNNSFFQCAVSPWYCDALIASYTLLGCCEVCQRRTREGEKEECFCLLLLQQRGRWVVLRNAIAAPPFFLSRTSLKIHLFYLSLSVFSLFLTTSFCICLSIIHLFSPSSVGYPSSSSGEYLPFLSIKLLLSLSLPSISLVLLLSIFFMLINEVEGVLNCCCLKAESWCVGFSASQHNSGYMSCTYHSPNILNQEGKCDKKN